MKIYFAGSIRGGRQDRDVYAEFIRALKNYGDVLTEQVGDLVTESLSEGGKTDAEIYRRDMAWLRQADALVAEVSTPSLGVGYEVAKAEEYGKPIFCLYRAGASQQLSAMIRGSNMLQVAEYSTREEGIRRIEEFLSNLDSS